VISIIVCSINNSFFIQLEENIASTIGCNEYELIKIDNNIENLSIARAYNKGIKQAQFNLLCFVHEDIFFLTENWGNKLIEIFNENLNIGILGVAGSKAHFNAPSSWFNTPLKFHVKHIYQQNNNVTEKESIGFSNGSFLEKVVSVDGVFLAMESKINKFFDETNEGFHGYDLELSLDLFLEGKSNYVTKDIELNHFSNGSINYSWLNTMYNIYTRKKEFLPVSIEPIKNPELIEKVIWISFIHKCFDNNQKRLSFFSMIFYFIRYPFSNCNFIFLKRLFIK
jgi:GT2 family glycosyltransferase